MLLLRAPGCLNDESFLWRHGGEAPNRQARTRARARQSVRSGLRRRRTRTTSKIWRLFQEQQTFPTTGSRRWTGAGKVERTEQTQDTHSLRANRQPRLVLFVMECLLPALPSVSAARQTRTIHRQRVAVNPHRTAPCHILQVLLARQTCFTRGHAVEGCLPAACCKKEVRASGSKRKKGGGHAVPPGPQ